MDSKILHIENVCDYNAQLGVETLHPLVSVVDMAQAHPIRHTRQTFGFYAIFLKEVMCGDMIYGRQYYDYQEGTLVCLAPGQVIGFEDNGEVFQPKGWALVFHPDLIRGTALGQHIREYSYFSYEVNEALHLSERERELVIDCMQKIRHELEHAIDRHSKRLITINIEVLLDYCLRFYERQFITRSHVHRDIVSRFEHLLDDYFADGRAQQEGLPTVKSFSTISPLFPAAYDTPVCARCPTNESIWEQEENKTVRRARAERALCPRLLRVARVRGHGKSLRKRGGLCRKTQFSVKETPRDGAFVRFRLKFLAGSRHAGSLRVSRRS